jgi:hypothetical protein
MEAILDEGRLKEIMKEALLELIDERRDLLSEVFADAMEQVALARAIQDGEGTEYVSREEVLKRLEGAR